MPDDLSSRLDLPLLAAGQLQKHITVNEALTRLDALVQASVRSRTAGPPASPVEGDLYIAAAGWSVPPGTLVRFDVPDWRPLEAPEGLRVWVQDEGRLWLREDGGWVELGRRLGEVQALSRFGLDATADAANPFLARLNSALWTARAPGEGGTGDLRLVFNKSAPERVLSLLFQSAWGGRAELGLIGDEAFSLKISADGGDWREALRVVPESGRVLAPAGAGRAERWLVSADGSWTPPAWARMLQVEAVGGGGGGARGCRGRSRRGTRRTTGALAGDRRAGRAAPDHSRCRWRGRGSRGRHHSRRWSRRAPARQRRRGRGRRRARPGRGSRRRRRRRDRDPRCGGRRCRRDLPGRRWCRRGRTRSCGSHFGRRADRRRRRGRQPRRGWRGGWSRRRRRRRGGRYSPGGYRRQRRSRSRSHSGGGVSHGPAR